MYFNTNTHIPEHLQMMIKGTVQAAGRVSSSGGGGGGGGDGGKLHPLRNLTLIKLSIKISQ